MRLARTSINHTLSRSSAQLCQHFWASTKTNHSASERLFADAAKEDSTPPPKKSDQLSTLISQQENWTGDESIRDAVLRMLVDKHKPLRSGAIQTADEKLKRTPPTVLIGHSAALLGSKEHFRNVENAAVSQSPSGSLTTPSSGSWATETLIKGTDGHRPWHTEFKSPSHATSSVKTGSLSVKSSAPTLLDNEQRKQRKLSQAADKLHRARESTLDYRLGLKKTHVASGARLNPVTVKGWDGLVEDKIERARVAGVFKAIKGHGQPIREVVEESNPFIAREQFLMNRIVQRNGAAPPWIDLQLTLEKSIHTFREILRQSWSRQAIRKLTTEHSAPVLAQITLDDVKALRDRSWELREQSYHDAAMKDVNSVVRKYNTIAPYSVRRPYFSRSTEVERTYDACAEDIFMEISKRAEGSEGLQDSGPLDPKIPPGTPMSLKDLWRSLLSRVVSWLRVRME